MYVKGTLKLKATQICQRVLSVSIYHRKQRMLPLVFTLVKMEQHVDD